MEKTRYFTAASPITPTTKQTEANESHPDTCLIFFGQRGKRQKRMTMRQIPPPRIQ